MKIIFAIVLTALLIFYPLTFLNAALSEIENALAVGDVLLARELLSYSNEFERSSAEFCVLAAKTYLWMNAVDSSFFWASRIADREKIPVELAGPLFRHNNSFRGIYSDFTEAVLFFNAGEYKNALKTFIKVRDTEDFPKVIEDYLDYFIFASYIQTGDTLSALIQGELFCKKHATILLAHVSGDMSQIYLSRGDMDNAASHLKIAYLEDEEKFFAAKIFLSRGDSEFAAVYLAELLSVSSSWSDSAWSLLTELEKADTLARSRSLEKDRKYESVILLLGPYVASHPSNAEASLILGRALRRSSRHQEALSHLERASLSAALRSNALYNLGMSYRTLGRKAEEEAVWTTFVKEFMSGNLYDDALVYLAELQIAAGQKSVAIELLKKVIESPHSNDMVPRASEMILKLLDGDELNDFTVYVSSLEVTERNASLLYTTAVKMRTEESRELLIKIANSLPLSEYSRRSERRLSENMRFAVPLPVDFSKNTEERFGTQRVGDETAMVCERSKYLYAFGLRTWARKEIESVRSPNQREKFLLAKTADAGLDRYKAIVLASSVKNSISGSCPSDLFFIIYPQAFRLEIERAARAFSLDVHILQGLVRTESLFDENIKSWAGAVGLAQLMPSTASSVAASLGISSYSLTNPSSNLMFGAKYLSDQFSNFKKIEVALAAYNAGPGNARKWICSGGEEDYISNIGFAETRLYVPKVLTTAWIYEKIEGRIF
ncbi:transglycosylase SLT domain-containing protein [candidate division WOR-3 bacterium]|nr:transglycosylase SLT domain-containing protein [candidate division WOR-3 bacterium]